MARITAKTKIPNGAILAVEESDTDFSRYKTVHDIECKALRDPEKIHVDAGVRTIGALANLLEGYAVGTDGIDDLMDAIKPCARKAIGL